MLAGLIVLAATAVPVLARSAAPSKKLAAKTAGASAAYHEPICQSRSSLCADVYQNPGDDYVGHDEPSIEYKSSVPGSGNDMTYSVTLPTDPAKFPSANGGGGVTWNFQLRPTFWFGLTMCATESAPEYTRTCTPDSDANNLVGTNPAARDYIGKHPGNAYMELQFYGPGYVPQFEGFGCSATQYCAAMTIDSFLLDQNSGAATNADCGNYILGGIEPINWAYVTRSGVSQAPANPLFTGTFSNPNFAAVNPDYSKDLMMNPGDTITIHMHDTADGFRADLTDTTTGQSGSMTASVANGFGQILFRPGAKTCKQAPYAFHPEYSTANPRGNTWTAHTYNVAFSDEIGHFENCVKLDANGNCKKPGVQDSGGVDEDDIGCVPGADSSLVHINGCFFNDGDWDGQSYQNVWPGTNPNTSQDQATHPSPIRFTSPLTQNGIVNYETIAFETDLPRIEASDSQINPPFCDRVSGRNCANPPMGAQFYPFFSTTVVNNTCSWQEGGNYIPGTVNNFGGSSTTEFGPLLQTAYPEPGFLIRQIFDNFNSGDMPNPCPVG
jgi:hypothetical protein